MINSLSSGPRITHLYGSLTPPIRSSVTGRSISESLVISPESTPSTRIHRNFSTSSEPILSPSASTSKMTRPRHSPHRSLGSRGDLDHLARLYHRRHSTDSSLSCWNLSITEKRTISRGIEQDEARAEERAEEKKKAVNVRRFAGMVRVGSDCPGLVAEPALTIGRFRSRKWEYMFNQNVSSEGRWPIRDEPLDPVEVQAIGMLVPLMEMNIPNQPWKNGATAASPSKTLPASEALESSERMGLVRTVKRRIQTAGAKVFRRPSLIFRITGAHVVPKIPLTEAQEAPVPCSPERPQKPKSSRHKISTTLLGYMGRMRPLESTEMRSPIEAASSSEPTMTADASLVSLPEAHAVRKSKPKVWGERHRIRRHIHSPSAIYSPGETTKILHPLGNHYESASRRRVAMLKQETHNYVVMNLLLGVIQKKRSNLLVPLEGVQVAGSAVLADPEGNWNGYSWESVKFREAGKHVVPAIGEGGLVLDRKFTPPVLSLLLTKQRRRLL